MTRAGIRTFAGPSRYIQGPGALGQLGTFTSAYPGRPLVVTDSVVRGLLGGRLAAALGPQAAYAELPGEITYAAVDAIVRAAPGDAGVVVGLGGGKCLDAGKAVSSRLRLPVITVPTIASNDSPASAAVAMYDERHVMVSVDRLARHPDLVLVDTQLVADAPAEFLRCGIGDAISKKFEAEGCAAGVGVVPVGGRPLLSALAVADACYRTLRAHAPEALVACENGTVTDALESVVEAVVLMSGLGFENGGLSLAHALTRGLTVARGASSAAHGRHVAWGLLVQLSVEGRPTDVVDVAAFLRGIGLPVCLGDLGMAGATPEEIEEIGRLAMSAPHVLNMPVTLDADRIAAAIRDVEERSPVAT